MAEDSKPPFGATGKFPQGKVHEADQGEIQFGVAVDHDRGILILNFGAPVSWLALPPDVAIEMANLLLKRALECPRKTPPV